MAGVWHVIKCPVKGCNARGHYSVERSSFGKFDYDTKETNLAEALKIDHPHQTSKALASKHVNCWVCKHWQASNHVLQEESGEDRNPVKQNVFEEEEEKDDERRSGGEHERIQTVVSERVYAHPQDRRT